MFRVKEFICAYQSLICAVGITIRVWSVNSQGHTVREDSEENQVLERPL